MGRGEGRGVTIGIDLNLPCLGVAFIARDLEAARTVLEACEQCGIGLSEPFYTSKGLCTAGVVELPWYKSFEEWLAPRVKAHLRRMLPEARRIKRRMEKRRLRLPVPEADAMLGVLAGRRLLEELPTAVAEDLERLVYCWNREWRRKYKWSLRCAVGRAARAVELLREEGFVVAKLERLRGALRCWRYNPRARRWAWR